LTFCRQLEAVKNKRVLLFEANRSLFFWLCYHARNNDVFTILDWTEIFPLDGPWKPPFCEIPKLEDVDLVVTHNQIIDTKSGREICLAAIDPSRGEQRENGEKFYWGGPPATKVYFLASRPVLANLRMRLSPGSEAKIFTCAIFDLPGSRRCFQG
jgi:hypothetical protein